MRLSTSPAASSCCSMRCLIGIDAGSSSAGAARGRGRGATQRRRCRATLRRRAALRRPAQAPTGDRRRRRSWRTMPKCRRAPSPKFIGAAGWRRRRCEPPLPSTTTKRDRRPRCRYGVSRLQDPDGGRRSSSATLAQRGSCARAAHARQPGRDGAEFRAQTRPIDAMLRWPSRHRVRGVGEAEVAPEGARRDRRLDRRGAACTRRPRSDTRDGVPLAAGGGRDAPTVARHCGGDRHVAPPPMPRPASDAAAVA